MSWRRADPDPRCGPDIHILGPSPDTNPEHTASHIAIIPVAGVGGRTVTHGGWVPLSPEEAERVADLSILAPEMLVAIEAYEALEEQRSNCEECAESLERAPEACGECFPFADDLRLKMRAVLEHRDRLRGGKP